MEGPLTLDGSERPRWSCRLAGSLAYIAGGAGEERTLRWNREAFSRLRLRPRVLVDVSAVSTETTVLGAPVSMPVLVAPTASSCSCTRKVSPRWRARPPTPETLLPLDGRDGVAGRCRRGGPGRRALVPALRLPRPRHHGGDPVAGARERLLGRRPHGGSAGRRNPRRRAPRRVGALGGDGARVRGGAGARR